MKKVTIVFDFESQSMDVSVNDARECVTPATTVEEMRIPPGEDVALCGSPLCGHRMGGGIEQQQRLPHGGFMASRWKSGCRTCRGAPCGRPHAGRGQAPPLPFFREMLAGFKKEIVPLWE